MNALEAATKDGRLDLGRLFPPLARYCPLVSMPRGLHRNVPQCTFLLLDCEEAHYGGSVGGGKSAALLMAALQYVDVPAYRALIIRRTFKQLEKGDGLIPLSKEWLIPPNGQRRPDDAVWNETGKKWTFPSGATIEFGHMDTPTAKYDYQGGRWLFIGFDELTQFNEDDYEYVAFSRAARKTALADLGIPRRVRSTANPGGIGHGWVKRRFIEPSSREPGAVFIPARIRDNPGLDADDYEQGLSHLPEHMRKQLMDGDWDVFEGAAFPEFDPLTHVIPLGQEPAAPSSWHRFEQMDFGVKNPTAWHLLVVDYDGNVIVLDEYYSPGYVSDHAAEILRRRAAGPVRDEHGRLGWNVRDEDGRPVNHACYGDPSINARTGALTKLGDPASVLTEFADHGLRIALANNDPRAGRIRLSEMLRVDPTRRPPQWAHHLEGRSGSPRYFVSERCSMLIEQLSAAPLLPIDSGRLGAGEIVDPDWEGPHGHAVAAARYGAMSRPRSSVEPDAVVADPRAARILVIRANLAKDIRSRSRRIRQDY